MQTIETIKTNAETEYTKRFRETESLVKQYAEQGISYNADCALYQYEISTDYQGS